MGDDRRYRPADLLRKLREEHIDGHVYRGESGIFPAPLWPSKYRAAFSSAQPITLSTGATYRGSDGEFFFCLPVRRDPHRGADPAAYHALMQREQLRYLCMSHIRNALGYALAEAMFQQAGWSSEGIDVSYDPLVAMSFALTTWDARGGHLRPRENPAVIYRWTVDDRSWTLDDLRAHNFYSCPSFVPTRSICRLLQRGTASSFRESVARYKDAIGWNLLEFDLDAVQGRRPFELISLPEAWMTDSRVERQAAGLIIPDQSRPEVLAELARRDDLGMMCDDARDDRGDRVPVGRVLSGGSFVENVAARPGVERFLVDVSSSKGIEEASPISPDVLLPTTDASFDLLANWISPYYAPAVQYGTMPLEVGQIFIDPIALWTALGEPEPERQFSR